MNCIDPCNEISSFSINIVLNAATVDANKTNKPYPVCSNFIELK